ncbi:hypothetical protein HYW74_02275 [Candidatus Pacearchaeota archaeon]|nr:hypothetical protein [Candidatus Pacearchaeota archaeon]
MQTSLYNALSNLKFRVKSLGEKLWSKKSGFNYHNTILFLSSIDTNCLIKIDYNLQDIGKRDNETKSREEVIEFLKEYFGPKSGLQASYCYGERCISRDKETEAHWISLYYGNIEKQKGNVVKGNPYRTMTLEVILSLSQKQNFPYPPSQDL